MIKVKTQDILNFKTELELPVRKILTAKREIIKFNYFGVAWRKSFFFSERPLKLLELNSWNRDCLMTLKNVI